MAAAASELGPLESEHGVTDALEPQSKRLKSSEDTPKSVTAQVDASSSSDGATDAEAPNKVVLIGSREYATLAKQLPRNQTRAILVDDLIASLRCLKGDELLSRKAAVPATEEDMLEYHSLEYVRMLRSSSSSDFRAERDELEEFGLVDDCPVFPGVFNLAALEAGGSLTGAELLINEEANTAIWWGGGRHHSRRDTAAGYCYVQDCVLAVRRLRSEFARVLYIDIDVHHPDGVEDSFLFSDKVVTLSFHKHGPGFFPGTGAEGHTGQGRGRNYTLNVPLDDGLSDATFVPLFRDLVDALAQHFKPQAVVMQCGADALSGDPLGCFNLSIRAYTTAVSIVRDLKRPLLLLGGGGYNPPMVARCWTACTAVAVSDATLEALPADVPAHEHFPEYKPDFVMFPDVSPRPDMNTPEQVAQLRRRLLDRISTMGKGGPQGNS